VSTTIAEAVEGFAFGYFRGLVTCEVWSLARCGH